MRPKAGGSCRRDGRLERSARPGATDADQLLERGRIDVEIKKYNKDFNSNHKYQAVLN